MNKLSLTGLAMIISLSLFAQQKKIIPAIKYGDNAKAGKYIKTRGIKLYYETYGHGQPLLLIHANGGSISNFNYQIPYFEKYYKVIAVDSRTQGKSVDTGSRINYEMMADDMNSLLDSLHIDSAYVIGWSDGAINGLLLAIHHPEKVKKLAITGANLVPDTSVFNSGVNEMMATYKAMRPSPKLDAATNNTIKLVYMMTVEPHISSLDLRKIACPVFVIGGDNDAIRPSHTLQIFENINQAYLWIIPGSGHATLQRYRDDFNSKVHDFFVHPYHRERWDDWDAPDL